MLKIYTDISVIFRHNGETYIQGGGQTYSGTDKQGGQKYRGDRHSGGGDRQRWTDKQYLLI